MTRFPLFPLSLMLACGLTALAGCDRQSAPAAQPQETPSGAADAAKPGGDASAGASEGGELQGTLDREHEGEAVPTYTFTDPAGQKLKLSDLKGKPVLVNLWATWCAPCVLEMPMLDKLAGEYAGKLHVVTVSQDMKGAEAVAPFFKEKGFRKLQPWLDPENDLAFYYSAYSVLPTTVLYDAKGKEIWRIAGGYDWSSADAKKLVDEALTP